MECEEEWQNEMLEFLKRIGTTPAAKRHDAIFYMSHSRCFWAYVKDRKLAYRLVVEMIPCLLYQPNINYDWCR